MTVSQWQSVSTAVSKLSNWEVFRNPLTRDILETKVSDSVRKSAESPSASRLLAEASLILEGCIETIREVEQQNLTAKDLISQLKVSEDSKAALQSDIDKQKEKYEMNMKKMALLIDKLTATIRQKDDTLAKLETVNTHL